MTNHKAIYSTIKEREELMLQITDRYTLAQILKIYLKKLNVFPTTEFEAIKYKNDLTFCSRLKKYLLDDVVDIKTININITPERVKEISFKVEKKIAIHRMDLKHKFPLI